MSTQGAATDVSTPGQPAARFVCLDAMRGIAALTVVLYHCGLDLETGRKYFWPRFGYLAVDLFFVLSGFVLAFRYDPDFARGLTTAGFMRRRLARLFPLLLLGSALSLLPPAGGHYGSHLGALERIAAAILAVFALPLPPVAPHPVLFPLNGVFWSLFFEVWVANFGYALFWKRLHGRALLAVVAASAIGVLWTERHLGVLNFGWGWEPANLAAGFFRVGFSFFAGVALARLHRRRRVRAVPAWLPSVVLLAALMLPVASDRLARAAELGIVLVLFPALVYFGASAYERRPAIGLWLGEVSYAVYAIHGPLLVLLATALGVPDWPPLPLWRVALLATAFTTPVALLAHAATLWVDIPLRRRLTPLIVGRRNRQAVSVSSSA